MWLLEMVALAWADLTATSTGCRRDSATTRLDSPTRSSCFSASAATPASNPSNRPNASARRTAIGALRANRLEVIGGSAEAMGGAKVEGVCGEKSGRQV